MQPRGSNDIALKIQLFSETMFHVKHFEVEIGKSSEKNGSKEKMEAMAVRRNRFSCAAFVRMDVSFGQYRPRSTRNRPFKRFAGSIQRHDHSLRFGSRYLRNIQCESFDSHI